MNIGFILLGALFTLSAIGMCSISKGAVHEIEGLILLLTGIICFCANAIIKTLQKSSQSNGKESCPMCLELMNTLAQICPHCGTRREV